VLRLGIVQHGVAACHSHHEALKPLGTGSCGQSVNHKGERAPWILRE
jgi:hypothetical protein